MDGGRGFTWAAGARRFETWENGYVNIIGLGAAVQQALELRLDAIGDRTRTLGERLREDLGQLPGVTTHDLGTHRCGIVTAKIAGRSADDVAAALGRANVNVSTTVAEHNPLDTEERGIHPLVRFSPHYYNTEAEIDRAVAAVAELAGAGGRTGDQTDQESRSAGHRASPSVTVMASIESVTLDVADLTAANRFYTAAFGLGTQVRLRASEAPTTGFRGFTLSLTVSQPATVNGLIGAALDAGATPLKPAAKSFWGYGGVVRAPDGTIWKVATSAKKDTGPATRQIDQIVLLLGVADVAASKRFYVDHGLAVAKSFGRKYVEFATASSPVKLALYGRRAAAKDAGVSPEGTGSHRLMIGSDAGPFTDPDGFAWEAAPLTCSR